ncbi:MAG: zinc-binding dehydrogenase [Planctomycetaceae bacterium]|nr:zinc-binding dehydrogenase [Planctomycetaceae bacterium]
MLAGQITKPGRIELIEIDEPTLPDEPGHIIFQPELTCLCGSDLPYFDGQLTSEPHRVGHSLHEMIGTVVDTNGERFRPGERVLAVPINQVGLFERYALTELRAIPLDPRPEEEHALLAQPLGTVLYALRKMPSFIDQTVAIVGQGPIGQMFCAVLRNLGARQIIAIDKLESRLALSPRMGATTTICNANDDPAAIVADLTNGQLADVVIEAVGHEKQQLNLCLDLATKFGRILSFGVPPETIDGLKWNAFFRKNLTIHTSVEPDFTRDFPLAMRWISEGRIDLRPLLTHRYPLSEIQTAYETFRDKKDGAQKVLVDFPAGK